jgi:thioredoxin-related protein
MPRYGLGLMVGVFVLLCGHSAITKAGLDATARVSALELLVFEHPDCTYCQVFRRDVAPQYLRSPHAAEAPMRFIDIAKVDTSALGLKEPLTMLPTAVLMKEGREIDRITGYWGRDTFIKMLAYLLARAG